MALIARTNNFSIATAAGTTWTHALGATPDFTYLTMRTSTGVPYVSSSNSQILVLASSLAGVAVDVEIHAHHSIIQ